jgi:hypothetical protein
MDGAVGVLARWYQVPQVEAAPTVSLTLLLHHPAVLIVSPARIEEIIPDVAVLSTADIHGLVDEQDGYVSDHLSPGFEHIEGKVSRMQCWGAAGREMTGQRIDLPAVGHRMADNSGRCR